MTQFPLLLLLGLILSLALAVWIVRKLTAGFSTRPEATPPPVEAPKEELTDAPMDNDPEPKRLKSARPAKKPSPRIPFSCSTAPPAAAPSPTGPAAKKNSPPSSPAGHVARLLALDLALPLKSLPARLIPAPQL